MNSLSIQNPVVQGQQLGWQLGSKDSGRWVVEYYGSEETMAAVETAIEMGNLTGFTLFRVKAGWQMSVRPKNETGWIVKIIPDEQAREYLAMMEDQAGVQIEHEPHTPEFLAERVALGAAEAACRALTEAVRAWAP